MSPSPMLFGVGDLARRLNQPRHRLEYVLTSRRIHPALRIGGRRLFTAEQADQIAAELEQMDARRGGQGVSRG